MNGNEVFSISDFAAFTRTTRDTLLYYDKIGILPPAARGENNYRYYSGAQLAIVNLIRTGQALGMPLADVKRLAGCRTPEILEKALEKQIGHIDEKIDEWVRAKKLSYAIRKTIQSVSGVDEEAIAIQYLPAEAIVMGELNDYSLGRTDYDALLSFYHSCKDRYPELDLNYYVWAMFSEERIKARDWVWPDRYYFYNPEGHDRRKAALYAIGYKRGGYGQSGDLYERMLEYIESNGFEISGPAYEEYPLNEICVADDTNYLTRTMITVREKRRPGRPRKGRGEASSK